LLLCPARKLTTFWSGIGPLSIPVAGIDDLISLKTGTGRSKDVLDIEELRKIKRQLAEEQHGQG